MNTIPLVDRITHQAVDWVNRVRDGELPQQERVQFALWLAESPVHVREYLSAAEAWGLLRSVEPWPSDSTETLLQTLRANHQENVVALKEDVAGLLGNNATAAHTSFFKNKKVLSLAAAIVLTVATVLGVMQWMGANVYRTERGEQRSVMLPDGSLVQLNTLSKIVVDFDGHTRRIKLPEGEAYFRVAADPSRPFKVETPFTVVRALGTEFNVYNRVSGTRVAVVAGKIQVAPKFSGAENQSRVATEVISQTPKRISDQAIALGPEQSIDVGRQGQIQVIPVPSANLVSPAQAATAWMQRRIAFNDERVDEAVREFNRYNRMQLQVIDPQLAALRISGIFDADDPKALVKYLEAVQEVEAIEHDHGLILQRRP